MITAQVQRGPDGLRTGFLMRGHAGFAAHGQDIVCAAVTALAETAVLGLRDALGIPVDVTRRDGYLECHLPDRLAQDLRERADLVLHTMELGLLDIAEDYGRHLKVTGATVR